MPGGMRHGLRRGTVAGSLMLGITGGISLVDATQALASTGYTITRYAGIGLGRRNDARAGVDLQA